MKEDETPGFEENPEFASLAVNPSTGQLIGIKKHWKLIEELTKENFDLKLKMYFFRDEWKQKFGSNLDDIQDQMEQMDKNIRDKETQILEKDKLLSEKEAEINQLKSQLEIGHARCKTLEQDLLDLKEQLSESNNLNNLLKLELSVYKQVKMKTKVQPKPDQVSIRELFLKSKNVHKCMERCISTNNILQQKFEELLLPHQNASFQDDSKSNSNNNANRSQHNGSRQNRTNGSDAIDYSNPNVSPHHETSALTKELQKLEAEDDQQVDSAHGSGDSELASSYRNNTSELLKQTIDIIETSSCSQHQQTTSLSRNLFGSPKNDVVENDMMADLRPLPVDNNSRASENKNSVSSNTTTLKIKRAEKTF